ncbi:cytochrome aa3 quinol oxidase subunit 1 apoprotein [Marininema mesophilum]|uniref:Cytochrome c oxidase subunit 1 n=2 Tax=Marininema mesophilum TaxID=1048340 RepID=A0A1H2Z5Q0_9BACL|nr:cytochrome aa3 quinol oxidase subunit 1 apoprotein [Marininema mesophilum]
MDLFNFKMPEQFIIMNNPLIIGAWISIILASVGIVFFVTKYKKWGYLWREWFTTVDHKKIGVMYILAALLMLFRGGFDAILMRTQLALPDMKVLDAQHYNEIFTTHGTIMILFMAMPFIIGLMNVGVPLQIGARDVAFPVLNAVSFWLFFVGAMVFNLSFVIGGSPDAGWTNYVPLSGSELTPGVGINYYLWGLQIAGIGTLATGINFFVTILKMRAPGMTLLRMPMFTWSTLVTSVIIIFAFPVLTITLALLTFDRLFGAHFFTIDAGGMPMMWANLFWIWGHPEVYIVILPAFGIFSDVISTFARKRLFGYHAMVISMVAISGLSFVVWVHHFFTMGNGPWINSIFSITTMLIAVPTGVKVFNWLFTMYKGRIETPAPMLWSLAFIPNFLIGGVTGVMLASAPADYQYHNSYFLVSHFHYVLIGGTVFGCMAGLYYWWPKIFDFKLNERISKWAFWIFIVGFNVCFLPMYLVGLQGMPRRIYTYKAEMGWTMWNFVQTIGAYLMGIGFILIVWAIIYSIRHEKRDRSGDPWHGRTLEWAIPSPPPHYNFSRMPSRITSADPYWDAKKRGESMFDENEPLKPIHMPNNDGMPIVMSGFMFIAGFGFVFEWLLIAFIGLLGVIGTMVWRSFKDYDADHYVQVEEIERDQAELQASLEGRS